MDNDGVSNLNVVVNDLAGSDFKNGIDCLRRLIVREVGLGKGGVWRDMLFDGKDLILGNPDDVDGNTHVFHPETNQTGGREGKIQPGLRRNMGTVA